MHKLILGDCLSALKDIQDNCINAMICDPPYPETKRPYGFFPLDEWWVLMKKTIEETRRILVPDGSAVFILQPNSAKVGSLRPWFFEFCAWCATNWNIVQDVWWHNTVAQPNVHAQRKYGLMRPSVKICLWLGEPTCYRNQDNVLLPLSKSVTTATNFSMELEQKPSGYTMRRGRCLSTAIERGGSTPFNFISCSNVYNRRSSGGFGHGAGTPWNLLEWWVKYITRSDDVVLDCFSGTAQTGLVAASLGRSYIGIERMLDYHETSKKRFESAGYLT